MKKHDTAAATLGDSVVTMAALPQDIALKNIISYALYAFPKSFINRSNEIILEPRNNVYFRMDEVTTELEFKCKMFAWVSRPIAKGLNKYWWPRVLNSFNEVMGTNFSKDEMYDIYDRLGNDVNRKLTVRFIESGYDMTLLIRTKAIDSTEIAQAEEEVSP